MTLASVAGLTLSLSPDARGTAPGGGSTCAPVSQWRTVDIYRGEMGRRGAPIPAGAAASGGAIYIVGNAGGGVENWVVRRSLDRGETWQTVDRFIKPGREYSAASAVTVDSRNGDVYVAGVGGIRFGKLHGWVVRKSTDRGATWTTVDDVTTGAVARKIEIDGAGAIYVLGTARSGSVLRRSTDAGSTWEEISLPAGISRATAMAVAPSGRVFIAGAGRGSWSVYSSADGRGSWERVDHAAFDGGTGRVYAGTVTPAGKVLFTGTVIERDSERWVLRQAAVERPNDWSEVDGVLPNGRGMALASPADGRVYVAGRTPGPYGQHYAYSTRLLDEKDNRIVFSDSILQDPEFLEDGYSFPQSAAVATSEGDIITAGYLNTDEGSVWVVRKLSCRP